MKLDAREAHYVLETLITRRRIAERHVREILSEREKEIAALRRRLGELERLGVLATAATAAKATQAVGRLRRKLSPKVRALRRQQGQYMGLVRRLKASQKARVSALREKKGLPAAIRLARSMGRS